jgi:N-formylglutamate amidohydrolase
MNSPPWLLERGNGPLLATAIHDGHEVRDDLLSRFALPEEERLREEDPDTGGWTDVAPNRLICLRSRFEADLNRPREKAVYRTEADAWGLKVWKRPPDDDTVAKSLAVYDAFYEEIHALLTRMVARYGRVVVLDLHSYNHRREGAEGPPADPRENPDINLGTGTMVRSRWASLVDRFIVDLRNADFPGHALDVRENVKFRGGYFPQWIHEHFEQSVCVLSVEVKKFYMDEWTGISDPTTTAAVLRALKSTVWGIYEELAQLRHAHKVGPESFETAPGSI